MSHTTRVSGVSDGLWSPRRPQSTGAACLRRTSASPLSHPIPQRLVHKSGCWPGATAVLMSASVSVLDSYLVGDRHLVLRDCCGKPKRAVVRRCCCHFCCHRTLKSQPAGTAPDKVEPVDTALVVAIISAVVALASAAFSGWTQLQVARREREGRAEERRQCLKLAQGFS